MWLSKVTIQVWPSGGALAVMAAPIAPAAPGLLSITVCQPVLSLTLAARMRATGSVVPPGGKGTTTRIGPLGQSPIWARAAQLAASVAMAPPASSERRLIVDMASSLTPCRSVYHRRDVRLCLLHGTRVAQDLFIGGQQRDAFDTR